MITLAERLCETCLAYFPTSEFRLRVRGSVVRQRECRACHNQRERTRRRRLKHKRVGRELAYYSRSLAEARDDTQVTRVVDQMVNRFGGIERLSKTWCYHLEAAGRDRPGCKRTFDFFRGLVQLMRNREESRKREYSRMSDAELNAAIVRRMQDFLRANPIFTLEVARSIGWKVKPPGDQV